MLVFYYAILQVARTKCKRINFGNKRQNKRKTTYIFLGFLLRRNLFDWWWTNPAMCRYHVGATDDATGEDPDAGGGCCGESATHAARLRRIGQHAGRTGSSDHVRLAEQHRKQQQQQPVAATQSVQLQRPQAVLFLAVQHVVHQFHGARQRWFIASLVSWRICSKSGLKLGGPVIHFASDKEKTTVTWPIIFLFHKVTERGYQILNRLLPPWRDIGKR